MQPDAEFAAQPQRLGRPIAALLLPATACLQPRQAGQPEGQPGLLPALPGKIDRFEVGGLGDGPAIGRGLVAGDEVEQEGKRTDGGLSPAGPQCAFQQRAARPTVSRMNAGRWSSQGMSSRSSRRLGVRSASLIASCTASVPAAASPPRIRAIPTVIPARKLARR